MSDKMFDEIPVSGAKYNRGDWSQYAVHDENNIKGFFGKYRWISNFEPCEIWYEGMKYKSSEAAYQACKCLPEYRLEFENISAYQAKKEWKKWPKLYAPEKWNEIKFEIMAAIVFEKFFRNVDLRHKLLETGLKTLVELNHWRDTEFGVDINLGGQNKLGQILMKVREFWK